MSTTTHDIIRISPEAQATIQRCRDLLDSIRYWHGDAEAGRAGLSFATSLSSLLVMGGHINSDRMGDSGLYNLIAATGIGLTVGMVLHFDSLDSTLARCHPDQSVSEIRALLGEKTLAEMPETGTWSLHS
jgi:hypothetical protein